MRFVPLLSMILLLLAGGCNTASNSNSLIVDFIPGTYVKAVKNEFLLANDTLIVQRTAGNNFLIVSRTTYWRIKGNRLLSPQHSEINLEAVFDDRSGNLNEQRLGKTFSFDPQKSRLFEGGSEYKKIIQ